MRNSKLIASHFGGHAYPACHFVAERIKPEKAPRPQFTHVNDIAPTIYEILNITPDRGWRVPRPPGWYLDGGTVSLIPKAPDHKHTQYFEIMGSRGIYHDGWMASAFGASSLIH